MENGFSSNMNCLEMAFKSTGHNAVENLLMTDTFCSPEQEVHRLTFSVI